ncbi:hypothetical protein N656DRAFT_752873 [Canariomyces notabilis]|uniref:Uncharacterized protein n=1 Tax=Canariomyces notabilis TaxID=2074819 RepID=A0AAN6TFB8_9PEZI|nr:hypothetical protein N656DRAFT_752873 [Canariomyces arenarius]
MSIYPDVMPAVLDQLREKARAEYRARIPIRKLDKLHRDALTRAINNVLSTELAIFTYAQIIDGLPTADVAWDRRLPGLYGDHPLDGHEELCPGAMEKAREICPLWDPDMLAFNPKLVNAFQRAAPGTKMFNTRLIELVAVALHQFGALLYQMDFRLHKGDVDAVVNWVMPRPWWSREEKWEPVPPRPSIFNHHAYVDDDIYPEGKADVVGYWVEDRIFGGVVVFDRRAETDKDGNFLPQDPPNIYLHPCRSTVTMRVTQLLDHQQQALVDFLLSDPASIDSSEATPTRPCPLPILVDDRNRKRYDPEDAITIHLIYRDVWERKPLDKDERNMMKRRPQCAIDYPEANLQLLRLNMAAGEPLPEGRYKRYLEGEGDLDENDVDEGPLKRALDQYMEINGIVKKVKLEHAPGEAEEKGGTSEGGHEGKGKEKEGEKNKGAEENEVGETGQVEEETREKSCENGDTQVQ